MLAFIYILQAALLLVCLQLSHVWCSLCYTLHCHWSCSNNVSPMSLHQCHCCYAVIPTQGIFTISSIGVKFISTQTVPIDYCNTVRFIQFLPHDAMHPRYYPWACVCLCLSVHLSVHLSQVGVLLKRLNVGSHKQHHTIALDSSFLTPKIAKFDRGHPLRGRRMQVGWVKIGDFRQISRYISKTVKDRHIVSIKVE